MKVVGLNADEIGKLLVRRLPLIRHVDFRVLLVSEGNVVLEFKHDELLERPGGSLFGGAIAMIFDAVLALTVLTVNDVGNQATVHLSIDFLRPARSERYLVEGRVIKKGRRLVFVDGELKDAATGKLFSRAHGVWTLIEK